MTGSWYSFIKFSYCNYDSRALPFFISIFVTFKKWESNSGVQTRKKTNHPVAWVILVIRLHLSFMDRKRYERGIHQILYLVCRGFFGPVNCKLGFYSYKIEQICMFWILLIPPRSSSSAYIFISWMPHYLPLGLTLIANKDIILVLLDVCILYTKGRVDICKHPHIQMRTRIGEAGDVYVRTCFFFFFLLRR